MRPAIIEQVGQSQFVCSACGAGRDCDCNAPAMERLAEIKEQARQRQIKKREQEQRLRHVTDAVAKGEAGDFCLMRARAAEEAEAEADTEDLPGFLLALADGADHKAKLFRRDMGRRELSKDELKKLQRLVFKAATAWEKLNDRLVELIETSPAATETGTASEDLSIPDFMKRQ